MKKETQSGLYNITSKAAVKHGGGKWTLKQRSSQRLEAAQVKFLRAFLKLKSLGKMKNT
jgi:hypothetical protein